MAKKRIEQCRSGKEFIDYAAHAGAQVYGGGCHMQVEVPGKGKCAVPNHPGDLATGTRFSIIKMFRKLGLAIIPVGIFLTFKLLEYLAAGLNLPDIIK